MKTPEKNEAAAVTVEKNPNRPVITLDTPIVRGSTEITEVTLRKPVSGELRGVTLTDLLQMDVLALRKVLPRITTPTLNDHEIGNMDPADLVQMATEVAGFLLPKSAKVDASLVA
ncbi:phage tail assembly protein [Pseudomonas bijieensis]|uniref:phage tail assembly protein n=1 Tax=Pseudomonas bijieensis TaxID=2681983 RepID=UPI001E475BB2|nr:phage tail assembly protein [Pseudomonas bijieensis]MCD9118334.1 phage tail assembly protein [Pseudomonas bijieensis]